MNLSQILDPELAKKCHLFGDINSLDSSDPIPCSVHGAKGCSIPSNAFLTTCGSSCTNFSKLFQGQGDVSRTQLLENMLREGKGQSGDTFQGMCSWLAATRR
jgi:hypothetical protein